MEEDGMIINFDLGNGSLKPKATKTRGEAWRERSRAKKEMLAMGGSRARLAEPSATAATAATSPSQPGGRPPKVVRQRVPSSGRGNGDHGDGERPLKRQRVSREGEHGGAGSRKEGGTGSSGRGGITSSLFTSNPTAVTKFDEDKEAEDAGPTEPSNAPLAAESFQALGISERLAAELAKSKLEKPTAIQKKTIPVMINTSDDAFIQAQTGSGKTLAYVLPMVHRVLALSQQGKIHRKSGLFGIILAPTRELAKQVYSVLTHVLKSTPWLVATAIIGGQDLHSEKARLRKGVNFLVATPGRLSHHIENTRNLMVNTVRWLILDEGDRLIEEGFEEQIRTVIQRLKEIHMSANTYDGVPLTQLPQRRVTVLCSATMKMTVQRLGEISLKEAVHIEASNDDGAETDETPKEQQAFTAPAQLKQSYIVVPAKLRLVTLMAFLKFAFARKGSVMRAIIFLSCADSVDFHFELLKAAMDGGSEAPAEGLTAKTVAKAAYITSNANHDIVLHKLYGSLDQPVRTATLKSFSTSQEPAVLITTDIASRGLDIPSVDVVVELDPAFSFEEHVHRVGRTARAGQPGKAVLFLQPGVEEGYVNLLPSGATAQSYDTVLQQALSIPWTLPFETHAKITDSQSYTDKAESLQLHIEQRLLNQQHKRLLELGRNGFRSHVRAYATHIKPERVYFDMTELHLGHVAKSFGLRDPPGGIGNGLDKKANKGGRKRGAKQAGGDAGAGAGGWDGDAEKDGTTGSGSRHMYEKLSRMMVNSGASEFNIG